MIMVNELECEKAGLDAHEVRRIAAGLSRYAKQAENLGITVFGGSGEGTLRFNDQSPTMVDAQSLIIAVLDGQFDGGDGGWIPCEDGYRRGE